MKIKKLTEDLVGKLISYKQNNTIVDKARIYMNDGEYFFVQDVFDGGNYSECRSSNEKYNDKFKGAWKISDDSRLKYYNITNIILLDSEPEYEIY